MDKRITPKEFSNNSQNDEIIKKQLELREREIALKEKEVEWRFQAVRKNNTACSKPKQKWWTNIVEIIALFVVGIVIVITYNILSESNDKTIIGDSLIELGIK